MIAMLHMLAQTGPGAPLRVAGIQFAEPAMLWTLLAAPLLGVLAAWAMYRRRLALRAMGAEAARGTLEWARVAMVVLAATLLGVGLARPQWSPKEQEVSIRGRDVVFVVDVSRSMLAADLSPSRLERAKLWMKDLASSLRGDRVALVAFAGASSIKCPLTHDYTFFRMAVDELSPQSVTRGGTLIGDAIRKATNEVFDDSEGRGRDIILITDGEDHESFPVQAAAQAGDKGIRIIAMGLGSELGAKVPAGAEAGQGFVIDGGREVMSKMDAATLGQVAAATKGGVFLDVGTGTIDLDDIYQQLVMRAEQSELGTRTSVEYEEHFAWFIGAALLLLGAELLIFSSRRSRVTRTEALA